MKVIGLTGGIGSGKSTVSAYLEELGAAVIDADKVGHGVFKPDTPIWKDVVAEFGREVLAPDGEVDRSKLGALVFDNPEALKKLNNIMHPQMKEMVKTQLEDYREKGAEVAVVEAFGLIEAGWTDMVDAVWVTVSSEQVVIDRLKKERGMEEEQIKARINSQLSPEESEKHADALILNDGTLDEMKAKVRELWAGLQV